MSANSLRHKATLQEYLMKYVTVSLSVYELTHHSVLWVILREKNETSKEASKEEHRVVRKLQKILLH